MFKENFIKYKRKEFDSKSKQSHNAVKVLKSLKIYNNNNNKRISQNQNLK